MRRSCNLVVVSLIVALISFSMLQGINILSEDIHVSHYTDDIFSMAQDNVRDVNITWMSFESPFHLPLTNGTEIVGNNITICTTIEDVDTPQLEIENITTELFDEVHEIMYRETVLGNTSSFSIPWLSYNISSSINITAITVNGTHYHRTLLDLKIMNTFTQFCIRFI